MTSADVLWIIVAMGTFTSVLNKEIDYTSIKEAVSHGKQCLYDFLQECKTYQEYDSKSLEVGSHAWMMMQNSYEPGKRTKYEDRALEAVYAAKTLVERFGLSMVDLQENLDVRKVWQETFCDQVAPSFDCSEYQRERSFDGTCNNLQNPRWGMAGGTMHRYLAPQYGDDVESPRMLALDGSPLMGPRYLSNYFFWAMPDDWNSRLGPLTVMNMAFGQFIDHDIINTAGSRAPDGSRLDCCAEDKERQECISVEVPEGDERFPNKTCLSVSRSRPALPEEGCLPNFRATVNTITAYLDASVLYGTSKATADSLRASEDGRMLTSDFNLMPLSMRRCRDREGTCFRAGDFRADSAVGLVALHTLYVRFHNQIANSLRQINPRWSNDKIFSTTRKIVIASHQHIIYNEFLPTIVGPRLMVKYGLWSTGHYRYNNKVDATIKNGFSTAAFRYGHSQVPQLFQLISEDLTSVDMYLGDTFFQPSLVAGEKGGKIEQVFRWLTHQRTKQVSRLFETTIRNDLFKAANGDASDLTSINVQRGRDHGLPPYNKWRQYCGLPPAKHFNSKTGGLVNHSPDVAAMLAQIYNDVDDIELYVGGVSEAHAPSSAVGPTFACIIARQFYDLKYGDRFWYENIRLFSKAQLYAIKQISLSKIICENTKLKVLQRNVFMRNDCNANVKMPCAKITELDLLPFRDPYAQVESCRNRPW